MWLLLALLAAFADGIKSIFQRFVLKTEQVAGYAFTENFVATALFGLLAIFSWKSATTLNGWLLLLGASVLWGVISVLTTIAAKHTQVSLRAPISQTRILFALALGFLIFGERLSSWQAGGVLLIFVGTAILTYKHKKFFGNITDKGVIVTLLVAPLAAIVALIDKQALLHFSPATYGMLAYGLPTIVLAAIALIPAKNRQETKSLIRRSKVPLGAAILLGAVAYYLMLLAYTKADASLVFAVARASTIVSVIGGGIVFHEEREAIPKRLLAAAIIIIGVLLASGRFQG